METINTSEMLSSFSGIQFQKIRQLSDALMNQVFTKMVFLKILLLVKIITPELVGGQEVVFLGGITGRHAFVEKLEIWPKLYRRRHQTTLC